MAQTSMCILLFLGKCETYVHTELFIFTVYSYILTFKFVNK